MARTATACILPLMSLLAAGLALSGCADRIAPVEDLRLTAAQLRHRPVLARLTGFPHARRPVTTRGDNPVDIRLHAASARVLAEHSDVRAQAIAHLVLRQRDAAVSKLQIAVKTNPHDAGVWNDLAVALLDRSQAIDDVQELVSSLAAADEALRLNARHPEARFTRAEVLTALGLTTAARRAYEQYLELDGSSRWAHEARTQITTLHGASREPWSAAEKRLRRAVETGDVRDVDEIVRAFPQYARAFAETIYLARWGEHVMRGDAGAADRELQLAATVAKSLAQGSGEQLLLDAINRIQASGERQRASLARAHVTFRDARQAYDQRAVKRAESLFDDAIAGFRATSSPMVLYARHYRANVAFDQHDLESCLATQSELLRSAPRAYRALNAQAFLQRATVLGHLGHYFEALSDGKESIRLFEALGETDNLARMHSNIAALESRLGNAPEAWRQRRKAFREISKSQNDRVLEAVLNAAARSELRDERWQTARAMFELQLDLPSSTPRYRFDALLGVAYTSAQETPGIVRIDAAALDTAARAIPDPSLRADALYDKLLAMAILDRRRSPGEALSLFDRLLDTDVSVNPARMPHAYIERARTHTAIGDEDSAIRDYAEAIGRLEQQGLAVDDDAMRDGFFGAAATAAYLELARIRLRRGEVAEALALVDRTRSAGLFPRLDTQELQQSLSADSALVAFATFPDQLTAFVVSRRAITAVSFPIKPDDFQRLRDEFTRAVRDDETQEIARTARKLGALVMDPAFAHAPEARHLLVVPDAQTEGVALAALMTADGRFAIERASITVAPSAAGVRKEARFSRKTAVGPALVVADPSFDRSSFPELSRLPAADAEARLVARAYPNATILSGADAVEDRVIDGIRHADVVHVAAHAVTNPRDSRYSAIPLAATPSGRGSLYVRDIRSLDLENKPLIVLAGCGTARRGGGESRVDSLAAAFLAAGSRAVIATIWDVDDQRIRIVVEALHQKIASGLDAATALRETQLAMISRPDSRSPRDWAGFQTYASTVVYGAE